MDAARREANEEAGIPLTSRFLALDSMCCVRADIFRAWKDWPAGTFVVKELAFSVEVLGSEIRLSHEHTDFQWCSYDDAVRLLKWDSNKTALWELRQRLSGLIPRTIFEP